MFSSIRKQSPCKIHIFGDSFADPDWNQPHDCNFLWPEQLAKKYHVTNCALKGTGPEYSLQKMHSTPAEENCACVFFVSDPNRLYLHNFWKHDQEQVHILDVAAKRIRHPGYMFVKQLYEHYLVDEMHSLRAAQTVAAINSLGTKYKRTLIFTIGDLPLELRLDPSVTFVNHSLIDISEREWIQSHNGNPYMDARPNHFSEVNHQVMYQSIVDWLEQGTVPDVSRFHQSIV